MVDYWIDGLLDGRANPSIHSSIYPSSITRFECPAEFLHASAPAQRTRECGVCAGAMHVQGIPAGTFKNGVMDEWIDG